MLNFVLEAGRHLTEAETTLLQAVAQQVGNTLERMLAFQEVQSEAQRDGLTGLLNRSYFFQLAERALSVSTLRGQIASLVMMDLDRFKKINDIYGHQCGDYVLAQCASLCQSQLRQTDLLGRYGGDEFVALLPETDDAHAIEIMERLRQSIASNEIHFLSQRIQITMSFGIATLPRNAPDALAWLIAEADRALYAAKRHGRNRVVHAQTVMNVPK